jgi:integrase/recombinase XerD
VQAFVDQFLDFLALERGLSPNTRTAYGTDLRAFVRFLYTQKVGSFGEVTRRHIVNFLMEAREAGLRTTTLARRLAAIKVFLRYLQQEGLLLKDVAETMDSPRLWHLLPDTLTTKEIERLLAAPDLEKPLGLRDRAILEVLYGSGLRVSELAGLQLDQIHIDERYLRCIGKGRKERIVPFGDAAKLWLQRYLSEERPRLARRSQSSAVFLSNRGRPLDRRTLWRSVRGYARRAGLAKDVHPHTLRHTFATHLLANNAPLRVIQEMLGHADIGTTQVYTHVDSSRLKSIHEKFHPRA